MLREEKDLCMRQKTERKTIRSPIDELWVILEMGSGLCGYRFNPDRLEF